MRCLQSSGRKYPRIARKCMSEEKTGLQRQHKYRLSRSGAEVVISLGRHIRNCSYDVLGDGDAPTRS
ncbi:hypothetical protein B0T14DRAFT_501584 [Immersiella caudata]|uniref:Uncharacterized protein n=1 Tax=Immersiella caudata TaxID=314043 RepID=A0AA39XCX2_9PEZI|nr:hypothetical protein B0T14DRAFT_501584 [Immersiella caudata]